MGWRSRLVVCEGELHIGCTARVEGLPGRVHAMKNTQFRVAVIKGDGIGVDVTDATLAVIDAAERLQSRPMLRFVLIGDGADRERLEDEIASRGLSNVTMLGLQPRAAMPDWIASIESPIRLSRTPKRRRCLRGDARRL